MTALINQAVNKDNWKQKKKVRVDGKYFMDMKINPNKYDKQPLQHKNLLK